MQNQSSSISAFLSGKTPVVLELYHHFINSFQQIGAIELYPTKSMIGISNGQHRIAWITAIGKNFIHVVFPFKRSYAENLCFQKIALVPGSVQQFNHHFRMLTMEDINEEVQNFMRLAYQGENT